MHFLLAEMEAGSWVMIITAATAAVGTLMTQIIQLVLDYMREQNKLDREARAAEVRKEQSIKLDELVGQVEEVHKATNSMKDELVASTDKAAHARGIVDERAAADEREGPRHEDERKMDATLKEPLPVAIVSVPEQSPIPKK